MIDVILVLSFCFQLASAISAKLFLQREDLKYILLCVRAFRALL